MLQLLNDLVLYREYAHARMALSVMKMKLENYTVNA